jgi:hypothetical protein
MMPMITTATKLRDHLALQGVEKCGAAWLVLQKEVQKDSVSKQEGAWIA